MWAGGINSADRDFASGPPCQRSRAVRQARGPGPFFQRGPGSGGSFFATLRTLALRIFVNLLADHSRQHPLLDQSRQRSILAGDRLSANDPKVTCLRRCCRRSIRLSHEPIGHSSLCTRSNFDRQVV